MQDTKHTLWKRKLHPRTKDLLWKINKIISVYSKKSHSVPGNNSEKRFTFAQRVAMVTRGKKSYLMFNQWHYCLCLTVHELKKGSLISSHNKNNQHWTALSFRLYTTWRCLFQTVILNPVTLEGQTYYEGIVCCWKCSTCRVGFGWMGYFSSGANNQCRDWNMETPATGVNLKYICDTEAWTSCFICNLERKHLFRLLLF